MDDPPGAGLGDRPRQVSGRLREKFSRDSARPSTRFTPEAIEFLDRHDWPGNVRELESLVGRGLALAEEPEITRANLAGGVSPVRASRPRLHACEPRARAGYDLGTLKEAMEEPDKRIIVQAL